MIFLNINFIFKFRKLEKIGLFKVLPTVPVSPFTLTFLRASQNRSEIKHKAEVM